jgi:hypothetical protein
MLFEVPCKAYIEIVESDVILRMIFEFCKNNGKDIFTFSILKEDRSIVLCSHL